METLGAALRWMMGRPPGRVTQQVAMSASKNTDGSRPMMVAMLVRNVFRGWLSACPSSAIASCFQCTAG